MGLIDYISRHPIGKPQPPAYWDKQFVVALVDDFVKCLEFEDSSINNISLNENPMNYQGTEKLNRNKNVANSISVHTQTAFTVLSQLFTTSRSSIQNSLSIQQTINSFKMNGQLQQDMALPPFKRIIRKCHNGSQT